MKSTHEQLRKIPTVPGLYRHESSGAYYGKKKIGGTKKVRALVTANGENITDRKLAEKALAAWISALTSPAPISAGMTFAELFEKFLAGKAGLKEKTLVKFRWVKFCFDTDFPEIWAMRVADIKPSHLAEFFAARRGMKAASFNELTMIVKNVFEIAVADEIIGVNPYAKIPKKDRRKTNHRKPDEVPTIDECQRIAAQIRNTEFSCTADQSADFVELMHRAALGQAELVAMDWADVRWTEKKINVQRVKTGVYFEIPIYPFLESFLAAHWEKLGKPASGKLLEILNPRFAIDNACKRLGLPRYSPRDFRKARIVWMLRKGVPVETIAKWQGHQDNGVLIRKTYAHVITSLDSEHEREQLALLAA